MAQDGKMKTYRDWPLLETLPNGWTIDGSAGSPLAGYAFVTNGKSVLNGQKRALLLVKKKQADLFALSAPAEIAPPCNPTETKPQQVIDAQYVRTVNELAREKFKQRILNDILVDLMICEIEGWCKHEYINELKQLIGGLAQRVCIDA